MSQNSFTLKLLGIEDQNIKIIDVQDAVDEQTNEHFKLILASLTYPIKRCVNCGFPTIVKNGFRKTIFD